MSEKLSETTEWFWRIVDDAGLADVPSDEQAALRLLVQRAARAEARPAVDREAVARAIDPHGWFIRDKQLAALNRMAATGEPVPPEAYDGPNYYTRVSIEKADAILALLSPAMAAPSPDDAGGGVTPQESGGAP